MSGLGLGLIAADEYFKEGDRRQARDYQQSLRDADLATLPERTEATRAGAQLRTKQATSDIGLVDVRAANESKRLGMEGAGLDSAKERQPTEIATARNKAEVDNQLSQLSVEELPRAIAQKKREGVMNDAQVGVVAIAKLDGLIRLGDSNQVISFMNAMNEVAPAGGKRAAVATVGVEADPASGEKVFVAKDAQGGDVVRITRAQMERIRQAAGVGGKTEFKTVNAGDSLVAIREGKATPVYTAPESEKSKGAKAGPLERDVGYLVRAHGMSENQALQHLNSAKSMSRQQFILKSVQDTLAIGKKPSDEDVRAFGELYDRAAASTPQSGGQGAAAGSNSGAKPTMPTDPAIRSLLGIP